MIFKNRQYPEYNIYIVIMIRQYPEYSIYIVIMIPA